MRRWVAVLLVLSGVSAGLAQTTKPAVDPAVVAALVTQLADDDFKTRESAKEKLAALGPAIAYQLTEAALLNKEDQFRRSIFDILQKDARGVWAKPTLVTMNAEKQPLNAVLADLGKQANVAIRNNNGHGELPDFPVTIYTHQQPFWSVLYDICRQTKMQIGGDQHFPGTINLERQLNGKHLKLPQHVNSGVLFLAYDAARLHTIQYADQLHNNEFQLSVLALVDPKVFVIHGPREIDLMEAVDDKGTILVPDDPKPRMLGPAPLGPRYDWSAVVNLKYHTHQSKLLKRLRGKARFLIAIDSLKWEVNLKDFVPVRHPFPGGTYTIKKIVMPQREGDSPCIHVRVEYLPGITWNDFSYLEQPYDDPSSLPTFIKIIDDAGRIMTSRVGASAGGKDAVDLELYVKASGSYDLGKPTKLIWSIPTSMVEIDVPVEFNDLPIP